MYYQRYFTPTKWKNIRSYYNGIWYQSKFEASYAIELDLQKKAKLIKDWKRQIPIAIYLHGIHITTYKVDFLVYKNDGSKEYVETKGLRDPYDIIRFKLLEATLSHDQPAAPLTMVRQGGDRNWPKFKQRYKSRWR